MKRTFGNVAIIGVGLLGASIGLGLKHRGLAASVTGIGRRRESLDIALARGAIDHASLDLDQIHGADLIIIATPAAHVTRCLDQVLALRKEGAVVTDVTSTKSLICSHADQTWPNPRHFVGSHPMAGSEKFGPEHAREDFYEGSVCIVEPQADHVSADAHVMVRALWEALGARVCYVAPTHHDHILARTSHLPHVVASALTVNVLHAPGVEQLVGNGFRDTTRIADSRPEIWRDICMTNRDALLEAIQDYRSLLDSFAAALEARNEAEVEGLFDEGRRARREILGQ